MSTYWPWWAGAIGLALVTINYALITDRSFGVSSAWDRVLHWRRERQLEEMDEEFADDQALAEALAAATAEHFGTGASPCHRIRTGIHSHSKRIPNQRRARAPRPRACARPRWPPRLPC